jgi:nucleotide-binding universal stress UspA family protein
MAGGLVMYVLHRRGAGHLLLRQPQETRLPSAALSDVDYDRILVPVVGTRLSDEMMVLGCQLAAEKNATIDVVYAIEVPMNLPLDAPLADERRRGQHVLDAAMAVAREFGVDAWPHLVTARQSGRAIVDTAQEWRADVIIVGAVKKRRVDDRLFGEAVTYVLRHAPGEVLVNLVPADYPMQGSAAEIEAERTAATPETGSRADADRK